jgi:amidase
MADDVANLDATAQAELVRTKRASPRELCDAAIARIERFDPELNAVIHRMFEQARREAASNLPDGPFRGVPFLIKDLGIAAAGEPNDAGLRCAPAFVDKDDSFLMQRFRAAGFVTLGKTNTPELGILPTTEPVAHGPTRNPYNPAHSTGGSSGGSAAAVAAGLVAVAHANDGGGSIRIPASACGLVGLKPSRGRVSLGPEYGDIQNGLVIDHCVARSVRDSAAVLDCIHGAMPGDPYTAPPPARPFAQEVGADPGRLRIGYTVQRMDPEGKLEDAHEDCVAAAQRAVSLLQGLGHTVEPATPEPLADPDYIPKFLAVWSSGVGQTMALWERKLGRKLAESDVEPTTWALHLMAKQVTGPAYLDAWWWLQKNNRRLAQWWKDRRFHLYLTPTMAEPPLPLGSLTVPAGAGIMAMFRAATYVPFTPPFNVTGQPAISLPLYRNRDGLPIGVQLAAEYGREDLLLRVASQIEAELGGFAHKATRG